MIQVRILTFLSTLLIVLTFHSFGQEVAIRDTFSLAICGSYSTDKHTDKDDIAEEILNEIEQWSLYNEFESVKDSMIRFKYAGNINLKNLIPHIHDNKDSIFHHKLLENLAFSKAYDIVLHSEFYINTEHKDSSMWHWQSNISTSLIIPQILHTETITSSVEEIGKNTNDSLSSGRARLTNNIIQEIKVQQQNILLLLARLMTE